MAAVYIISDNQFFALGAAGLLWEKKVVMVSPDDILRQSFALSSGTCYIFVRCRQRFRQLCQYFRQTTCKLIFFLPSSSKGTDETLFPCFWPSRISMNSFRKRSTQLSRYLCQYYPENSTALKRIRLHKIAEGVDSYMLWISTRSVSPGKIHAHHRALMSMIGLKKVSVHTLFLSEYIAAGHLACEYALPQSAPHSYQGDYALPVCL